MIQAGNLFSQPCILFVPLQTILSHSVICRGQGSLQPLLDKIQNVWSVASPLVSLELGPPLMQLMFAILVLQVHARPLPQQLLYHRPARQQQRRSRTQSLPKGLDARDCWSVLIAAT